MAIFVQSWDDLTALEYIPIKTLILKNFSEQHNHNLRLRLFLYYYYFIFNINKQKYKMIGSMKQESLETPLIQFILL